METIFDFLSIALFIATVGTFFHRFRHENPPLAPYVLIALVCAVANWLGNNSGAIGAIGLLSAASFFLLQLSSEPYRDDTERAG